MLTYYIKDENHLAAHDGPLPDVTAPLPVWIDLLSPTLDEIQSVERVLEIDIPSEDDMQEIEFSSRVYTDHGARIMTITELSHLSLGEPEKTPVTFILKNDTLVTLRHADSRPFSSFTATCQKPDSQAPRQGEGVMLGIIEAIVDRAADALEVISGSIDGISRSVFGNRPRAGRRSRDLRATIEQIGHEGDTLSMIQESLVSLRRVTAYHAALDGSTKRSRDAKHRIDLIERDAASLVEHAGFLNNKIAFLLDATLGLVNLEQSGIIKIFSVVSVVFLPPTLVASVYGMNFRFMPELDWPFGYPLAIVLMLISALLPYLYFKHKHWL